MEVGSSGREDPFPWTSPILDWGSALGLTLTSVVNAAGAAILPGTGLRPSLVALMWLLQAFAQVVQRGERFGGGGRRQALGFTSPVRSTARVP